MKTQYRAISLYKTRKEIGVSPRIHVNPLVFKYGKLLKKALLYWEEGTFYYFFHLYLSDISEKGMPLIINKGVSLT